MATRCVTAPVWMVWSLLAWFFEARTRSATRADFFTLGCAEARSLTSGSIPPALRTASLAGELSDTRALSESATRRGMPPVSDAPTSTSTSW